MERDLELGVVGLSGGLGGGEFELAGTPGGLDGVGISNSDFLSLIAMIGVMLFSGYLAGTAIIISWNHTKPRGKPVARGSDGGRGEFTFEPLPQGGNGGPVER